MSLGTILYLIGSIMFIVIGLLHTLVHYKVLTNSFAQSKIEASGTLKLGNDNVEIWKLWQGMSLLFGLFMVFVGALDITSWYDLGATTPSSIVCIINMALLLLVIYSGVQFFGKMQIYGGFLGFIFFGVALLM